MIYKIPIVGFVYAFLKIHEAQSAAMACYDSGKESCSFLADATWEPLHHFNESVVYTMIPLVILWFIFRLIGMNIRRKHS